MAIDQDPLSHPANNATINGENEMPIGHQAGIVALLPVNAHAAPRADALLVIALAQRFLCFCRILFGDHQRRNVGAGGKLRSPAR